MEPNSHKYLVKGVEPEKYPGSLPSVNVSRSIGNSGNWIGCGTIDKTGSKEDHHNLKMPFYSLVYLVKGRGRYVDEKNGYHQLESGSLFQRRPGLIHSTTIEPEIPWFEYYFDCNTEYFNHLCDLGILEKDVAVYQLQHDSALVDEFDQLMKKMADAQEQQLADVLLIFINVLRRLINQANLTRESSRSSIMVKKACLDFTRYFDRRLDIREYCRQNGYGYEYFRKEFKKNVGTSPGKYLVKQRLDKGCHLLRSTTKSINEISIILGYKSQYEFSNQFKKQFGVFPKHFREGVSERGNMEQIKTH